MQTLVVSEDEDVLPVIPGDVVVVPNVCSDAINREEPAFLKSGRPEGGPLFVEMMSPSLMRSRSAISRATSSLECWAELR